MSIGLHLFDKVACRWSVLPAQLAHQSSFSQHCRGIGQVVPQSAAQLPVTCSDNSWGRQGHLHAKPGAAARKHLTQVHQQSACVSALAGDVIYTNSSIQPPDSVLPNLQCFWEAFPSGSGPADRTTYMFTYIDAQPTRPSLLTMMEEYWKRMPVYQVPRPSSTSDLMPWSSLLICVAVFVQHHSLAATKASRCQVSCSASLPDV